MKKVNSILVVFLFLSFLGIAIFPPWSIYGPTFDAPAAPDNHIIKKNFAGWYFIGSPPPYNQPLFRSISPRRTPTQGATKLQDGLFDDLVLPETSTANRRNYLIPSPASRNDHYDIDFSLVSLECIPLVFLSLALLITYRRGGHQTSPRFVSGARLPTNEEN
ncbi:MAG: hypothetical protein GY869_32555 [Planctomycetes bacterium]|nr:hypothetical protein [Planctomycetota bacterium]